MKVNNLRQMVQLGGQALAVSVGSAAIAFNAFAQQPAAAAPQKIDKIEVTGSLIKRVDTDTPSSVQIITAADIKNSGYATVDDLLRSLSAVDASYRDARLRRANGR